MCVDERLELLYVWIEKDKNGVFDKQGFSFTKEYDFSIEENSERSKIISITKNSSYVNIFKSDVITNICSIFGVNGVGKTSLIDSVLNNYKSEEDRYTIEVYQNKSIKDENNEDDEEAKDTFYYLNNLKYSDDNPCFLIDIKCDDSYNVKEISKENGIFTLISKIKLNNSYELDFLYNLPDRSNFHSAIYNYNLLENNKDRYYSKRTIPFYKNGGHLTPFVALQEIINSMHTSKSFQHLLDIRYIEYLLDKGNFDNAMGKMFSNIRFGIQTIPERKDNLASKIAGNQYEFNEFGDDIINKAKEVNDYIGVNFTQDMEYINNLCNFYINLKKNLIIELQFVYGILDKYIKLLDGENLKAKDKPSKFKDFYNDIILLFKTASFEVENEYNTEAIEYYLNAIEEITELDKIITDIDVSLCIDYSSNPETFVKVITHIESIISSKKPSFVIKYLFIHNMECSSGERALQNFMSWIYNLEFLSEMNNRRFNLQKNIILFVDEIDLYLHPKWQHEMLKKLMDTINIVIKDRFVQLIFSTHSPIMLSDIPHDNLLYLKKNSEGRTNVERKNTKTFGANLHSILRDEFILPSSIGSFAKATINNLYDSLKNQTDEYNQIQADYIINCIGEPIVKNKLRQLYNVRFPESKDAKIRVFENKIDELNKQLSMMQDEETLLSIKENLEKMIMQIKTLTGENDD